MLTLLSNVECYTPKYTGKKNIIIAGDKIYRITDTDKPLDKSLIQQEIPCAGMICFPGLIDQHVHIIGGGGEEGAGSRIGEIDFESIISSGVTGLVGVLGLDNRSKTLVNLLVKARELEQKGITTHIYSGSYTLPPVSLTGSIADDLLLIDKVIGLKLAVSDIRSSDPSFMQIKRILSELYLGRLLSQKPGLLHLHIGEVKSGLDILFDILENTDYPPYMYIPTHVNRNKALFNQAADYCRAGGYIDLTAGEMTGITVPDALESLLADREIESRITVSSDANGSIPSGGAGRITGPFDDLREAIMIKKIPAEIVFRLAGENVAKLLRLYPKKGIIAENSNADIVVANKRLEIMTVISSGRVLMRDTEILK